MAVINQPRIVKDSAKSQSFNRHQLSIFKLCIMFQGHNAQEYKPGFLNFCFLEG